MKLARCHLCLVYFSNYILFLVLVTIVTNVPYERTGFEYGQETIFSNFQVNLLVASIILSGFVCLFLWPLVKKWTQFTVSSLNLALVMVTFCWIFSRDLNSKAFVTYNIASNHTGKKYFCIYKQFFKG